MNKAENGHFEATSHDETRANTPRHYSIVVAIAYSLMLAIIIATSPGACAGLLIGDAVSQLRGNDPRPLDENIAIQAGVLVSTLLTALVLLLWAYRSVRPWYDDDWCLGSQARPYASRTLQVFSRTRVDSGGLLFVFGGVVGPGVGLSLAVLADLMVKYLMGWSGATLDNSYGLRRLYAGIILISCVLSMAACRSILRRGVLSMSPIDPPTPGPTEIPDG